MLSPAGIRGVNLPVVGGLIAILSAAHGWAAPPHVVRTVPANGAADVDAALTELRVEFDQDMGGGCSWCGGGPSYPEITATPRWESARICVLPVKLRPGKRYELSVNCPAAQNFRSTDSTPAEIYPLTFFTAFPAATPPAEARRVSATDQVTAVSELRKAVDQQYSYRDLRHVDWSAAFAEFRKRLEAAPTAEAFAVVAGELLARAQDMHIWLEVDGHSYAAARRNVPPNCNFARLPELVRGWQRSDDCVAWGRLGDDVGYVQISSWGNDRSPALEAAYAALWELDRCHGLIVDVRLNVGGSEALAADFAGCFVDVPSVYAKHRFVDPEAAGGFGPVRERTLVPNKLRPKYRGRVAVLIGPYVMSSCESFALMMKQVPGCKLIGATTYGSSGNPQAHKLSNGVTVYLPCWQELTPDGKLCEGVGVPPDVPVEASGADFEKRDPVLEAAVRVLDER